MKVKVRNIQRDDFCEAYDGDFECPSCGSDNVKYGEGWAECNDCKAEFTVKYVSSEDNHKVDIVEMTEVKDNHE